jgi:uncharacterized protein
LSGCFAPVETLGSKFYILNKRGQRLAALMQGSASARGPIVVVCHGFTGSKEGGGRALEMGAALAARGYSCLLFDFAGCGESDGLWEEISLSRQLEDLDGVVQWCRDAGFGKIILNGRSFGGATALCYGAAADSIAGLCTWSAPARLTDLFCKLAGGTVAGPAEETVQLSGEEGVVCVRKGFFYDLKKHDLIRCAARIAPRPLLVIHGTADEVVPSGEAALIAEAAGEPKILTWVEGADHRFSAHMSDVWGCFFDWLNRYF